jgi:hypothetical protein
LQQRVIDEFTDWAVAQGRVPAGDARRMWRERITILLQARSGHLDRPDPTRWRSGDVHDLLMTYVVPRQVDAWNLAERGVETVRDFLCFLDETDRPHPASTRVATLVKELDRLAPRYPAAMADTSRWRLAERVFTAVRADGISLGDDPVVLDAWAERFSARDAEGRREVLGELMDLHPEYATGKVLIHDGQVAVLRAGMPAAKHLVWPDSAGDCGCDQPVTLPADRTARPGDPGEERGRRWRRAAAATGRAGRVDRRSRQAGGRPRRDSQSRPGRPARRAGAGHGCGVAGGGARGDAAVAVGGRIGLTLPGLGMARVRCRC